MIGAAYGLAIALPQLSSMRWHWFGSVWFVYGEPLSLLPGIVLELRARTGDRWRKGFREGTSLVRTVTRLPGHQNLTEIYT